MIRNKLLVAATAVGALAVTAGVALAVAGGDNPTNGVAPVALQPTTSTSTSADTTSSSASPSPTSSTSATDTTTVPAGQLTGDLAAQLVRERFGGTVTEIERESEHGRLEWKVEIQTADGELDVRVDAATAEITRIDGDDDDRGRGGDDNSGHGDDYDDNSGYGGGDDNDGDR